MRPRTMPGSRRVCSPFRVALVNMSFLSLVVVRAPQVLVVGVSARRPGPQRLGVEAVAQDRLDRAIGQGAHRQGAGTGGLDPLGPVAVGQADDPQAAPVALLGMRPRL